MSVVPVDARERERARHEHDRSFVIEAGAGTGKTTLLIDRILSLLTSGRARLDEIAAVTYTENAAGTLKLRLRERLERERAQGEASARERAEQALGELERAAIATIHAFCAALLQERPLECGVVPGFRVVDEAESDLLFAEVWDEWLAAELVRGDDAILAAIDAGIPLVGRSEWEESSSLRGLARSLIRQRDLAPLVAPAAVDPEEWRNVLLAKSARAEVLRTGVPESDTLAAGLGDLAVLAGSLHDLEGDALESRLLDLAHVAKKLTARSGERASWGREETLAEAREIAQWVRTSAAAWAGARSAALHGRLVRTLSGVVALYRGKKAARGLLDFLDLLLKAKDALETHPSLPRYFHARYPFVIIDEFQDTDPLQVRIAELLTGGRPGALTVVGDPKQSIYRFRRADVRLFTRVVEEARTRPGHELLRLTQNFRSRPSILRFVNRVFASVIQSSASAAQPAYEPIAPLPAANDEPSVVALSYPPSGDDLLPAESEAIVRFVGAAARGEYEVRDPAHGQLRPSCAGDVMILARRLTQARHLEDALEAAGIRFVVEGGKSFFDRQEVHETLAVLRAVDDPGDRTALVAALRSAFFGVSDRDIVCYALAGGRLWIGAVDLEKPGGASVGPALELLGALNKERRRQSPAALLERLYDETRILAALTGTRRGQSQAANLEKLVAMARQAETLGVLTLRGFADLVEARLRERSDEPDLPSTRPGDRDTLRVLTIHRAKGLEAPIVILYDGTDNARPMTNAVPLWEEEKIAIGFRRGCQPPDWERLRTAEEERAQAETKRLLYVACTRARDWLVIPVPPEGMIAGEFWKPLVLGLPDRSDADVRHLDATTLPAPEPRETGIDLRELAAAEGGDPLAARWEQQRRETIAAASVRPFVPISATKAAARNSPPPVVATDVPRGRGRFFGALVHRILEWLPLDEAERAGPMAEALAPSFGLDSSAARQAARVVSQSLALPVMERARRSPRVFRELPIWLPHEGELVEGIIDLAFEEAGALIVVDYKTDRVSEDRVFDQAAHHAEQLRLYGRALKLATGMEVRERLVLFTDIPRAVPV